MGYNIKLITHYILSITTAEAPPPPLHMAAAPILALFCSKTFNNVIMIPPET
jgi:hypothetical protein